MPWRVRNFSTFHVTFPFKRSVIILPSENIELCTGAPQGCVLSPTLFTLFTHDCQSEQPGSLIIKFADNTTLVGLVTGNDESGYRQQADKLFNWCENNSLVLNADKTKEMINDFRRNKNFKEIMVVKDKIVETVQSFKLLGTIISDDMKWQQNSDSILRKARQRIYFLRTLKSFRVNKNILRSFYNAIIENVLTFGIIIWFEGSADKDKQKLNSVIKNAAKITGLSLPLLEEIYLKRKTSRENKQDFKRQLSPRKRIL